MNPEVYNFDFGIEADYLVLTWKGCNTLPTRKLCHGIPSLQCASISVTSVPILLAPCSEIWKFLGSCPKL